MRLTPLLTAGAMAIIATGCGVETAADPSATGAAQRQVTTWSFQPDHTSRTHWHYVDPDRIVTPSTPFNVRSTGLITVDLSATLAGAPVAIRLWDNGDIGHPSRAIFAPGGRSRSYSFTFSIAAANRPAATPFGSNGSRSPARASGFPGPARWSATSRRPTTVSPARERAEGAATMLLLLDRNVALAIGDTVAGAIGTATGRPRGRANEQRDDQVYPF
jgi:hypothetical protein